MIAWMVGSLNKDVALFKLPPTIQVSFILHACDTFSGLSGFSCPVSMEAEAWNTFYRSWG